MNDTSKQIKETMEECVAKMFKTPRLKKLIDLTRSGHAQSADAVATHNTREPTAAASPTNVADAGQPGRSDQMFDTITTLLSRSGNILEAQERLHEIFREAMEDHTRELYDVGAALMTVGSGASASEVRAILMAASEKARQNIEGTIQGMTAPTNQGKKKRKAEDGEPNKRQKTNKSTDEASSIIPAEIEWSSRIYKEITVHDVRRSEAYLSRDKQVYIATRVQIAGPFLFGEIEGQFIILADLSGLDDTELTAIHLARSRGKIRVLG